MVADTLENDEQKTSEELTPEELMLKSLLPVTFMPDMTGILKQAEAFQQDVNQLSLTVTKDSITELYAISTPAVELALASMAESINLKQDLSDFFKPATSS